MFIVDILVDFLWLSTESLGLDFSKMSRRRAIVAIVLWSVSNLMFIAAGILFLLRKVTLFEEPMLNLISGFSLLLFGVVQLAIVWINGRAAILKNWK